jgi:hypothetical protein
MSETVKYLLGFGATLVVGLPFMVFVIPRLLPMTREDRTTTNDGDDE